MDEVKARTNGHSELVADAYGPELELEDLTLDELRDYAVEMGVEFYSPTRQTRVAEIRAAAREQAALSHQGRIEHFFLIVRQSVQVIGHTVLLLVTLIVSYLFLPVAVLGLGVAEFQRVHAGIHQFDPARSTLMSAVAITTYMLLLFIQAQMLHERPDYQRPEWSLRLTARRVAYWVGFGKWEAQYKGTFELLRGAIGFLATMIVLLGTSGALETEIAAYQGSEWTWHTALADLVSQSDLPTFINLLGGMLLTVALLAGLHFVVMLTYERYVQLVPDGGTSFLASAGEYSEEQDRAEALYWRQVILRRLEQERRQAR